MCRRYNAFAVASAPSFTPLQISPPPLVLKIPPPAFNETNHIRQGVVSSLSLIVIYLGTGVTEIPTFNPGLYLILFSMCINTAQFLVILNIFAPKLIKILRGHNADLNDLSHAVDHVRTYSSSDMSSRKRTTSRLSGKSNGIRTGR